MKTLICALIIALGFALPNLALAKEKPLRNSALKKVKMEGLSFKGRHRFGMVSQPTRRGAKAQRFEIRHGDCGRSSGWNDCENDRGRVEMKETPKNSMSKPGKGVWYGYSILIPKDFVSLGRGNTMLGQVKAEGWLMPMWSLTFNDYPYLNFADNKKCKLGSLSSWKGKWIDLTIYAYYGHKGQKTYFQLFKNGKLICQRNKPFIPAEFTRKKPKLGLKYGIYNSFVSRYLAQHGRIPQGAKAYNQSHEGGNSKSPSPVPYKFDWGVKMPTHVIYYDEMRYGSRRQDVDVRMLEKSGVPPVD